MLRIPVIMIMIIIMNLQPRPRGLIELNISESKRREKREGIKRIFMRLLLKDYKVKSYSSVNYNLWDIFV